ncbi:hypothetical protein C8N40_11198 [Pontibacter mucosus]|uniref:Uncharacterized protein n=1 Tax=Pontibacter mucosus TaxID=1649266 RepID=A0A2T5YD62_9BACT|nr:hypothetical protein [Pontibacter mucosus]PTX14433.1 hypothetical protein C8N40_11198 [Pontibacter mucosus]
MKVLLTNPGLLYVAGAILTFAIIALSTRDWQYLRQEIYPLLLVVLTWPGFWLLYAVYLLCILGDWVIAGLKRAMRIKPRQLFCRHDFEFAYWIPEEHLHVHRCHKCGKTRGYELLEDGSEGKLLF